MNPNRAFRTVLPAPILRARILACLGSLAAGLLAAGLLLARFDAPAEASFAAVNPGESIQAAINAAAPGAVIQINAGAYTESLVLTKSVSLAGAGSGSVTIHALANQRVISITGFNVDPSVNIAGLTLAGGLVTGTGDCPGDCGGGIYIGGGARPALHDLVVRDNTAAVHGGGIYVAFGAAPAIHDVQVLSNTAGGFGGGLYAISIAITNAVFAHNASSLYAGGAYVQTGAFTSSTFQYNRSANFGGGIYAALGLTLTESDFISNVINLSGGGVFANGPVWISGGTFERNACLSSGCTAPALRTADLSMDGGHVLSNTNFPGAASPASGAVMVNGRATIADSLFAGNRCLPTTSCLGGALAIRPGFGVTDLALTLTHSSFISNLVSSGGGALAVVDGSAVVRDTIFDRNACVNTSCVGGAIYANVDLELEAVQVLNSTSHGDGGGVWVHGSAWLTGTRLEANACLDAGCFGGGLLGYADLELVNSLVYSNSAAQNGGGLGSSPISPGYMYLDGSEFRDNTAGQTGGGVDAGSSYVEVVGALFADNTAGDSGGGLQTKASVSVTATRFLRNAAGIAGGGLSFYGAFLDQQVRLVNNLFAGNTISPTGQGAGVYFQGPSSRALLLHNTFASPGLNPGQAIVLITGTVGITDTLITSHSVGISNSGAIARADFNLFFGNTTNKLGSVPGGNDQTGGPNFANPAAGDYRLLPGSAAIDQGTDVGVDADFEGDPRPLDGVVDIGYDERKNIPPITLADSYATPEDTPLSLPAPGVLGNDTDPDSVSLTASLLSGPATGTLSLLPGGGFVYTPSVNFNGLVTFTYRASDGADFSAATLVTIDVTPVDDDDFELFLPLVLSP